MKYPKQLISRHIGRAYDILYVREIDGFVLAMVMFLDDVQSNSIFYVIFAFPIENGIGGRLMYQWNSACALCYYKNQTAADFYMCLEGWAEYTTKKITIAPAIFDPRW